MKKMFFNFLALLALLGAASCHHSSPDMPEPPKAKHAVIIYMVADNNLSYQAVSDTAEIVEAQHLIPEDCRVILFVDRSGRAPHISVVDSKEWACAYQYPEEVVSTDSAVMVDGLRRAMSLCPAKDYSLVLWSHGSGWEPSKRQVRHRAFGQDKARWMEIPTLRGVLEQLPKFKFILFDACFMQNIETAYELRHTTDWMIGSPAEIPGPGAPYGHILESMCRADANDIVQNYHDFYDDPNGAPLSAIRTDMLDTLAEVTSRLLPPLFAERSTPGLDNIQQYKGLMGKTEEYDIKSAVFHLVEEEEYKAWLEVYEQAVPVQAPVNKWTTYAPPSTASLTDVEHYGGVSIYLPSKKYDAAGYNNFFQRYQWYQAAGWDTTGW